MIIYLDQSGAHEPSDAIAVIGYAASEGDWEGIQEKWRQILDLYGVPEFRFVKEQKRQDLIEALFQIVRDHTAFGMGGVLNVQDYERCVPDWFKRENEHPYYFVFQLFFDMLLGSLERLLAPPLPPDRKLTFVLDQNQFMQRAAGTFLQLKSLRDTHDRMGTITFKSRKDCPLLEVADLIACLVRDEASRRAQRPEREWAKQMRQRYNLIVGLYDKDNIPGLVHRIMVGKLKAADAIFAQATGATL